MDFYKILNGGIGVGMSNFDRLFVEKHGGGGIQEITGTLPLTLRSRASQLLENYRIYGASGGVGDKTVNLFDGKGTDNYGYYTSSTGVYNSSRLYRHWRVPVQPGDVIRSTRPGRGSGCLFHNGEYIGIINYSIDSYVVPNGVDEATNNYRDYAWDSAMMTLNQPLPTSYVPYGYQILLKVIAGGTTTDYPVYIGDSQLMEGEYVDYEEQKIYKLVNGVLTPTDPPLPLPDITLPQGTVTIDIEGELKPQVTIKGLISPTN